MIVACQNCGAPLDVRGASPVVDCSYCGRVNRVASARTLMAVTPPDWVAPSEWTDADRERARNAALAGVGIAAATSGLGGCAALGFALVVVGGLVLMGLGIFLAFALRS